MRLLRRGKGNLVLVNANEDVFNTPYAILSHTWGREEEEVTFQDVQANIGRSKLGYSKIQFTLDQARQDGIEHVWVDTCCINKHNYTELAKAINLMYDWYANAAVCYVYLSDVTTSTPGKPSNLGEFEQSRWFSRGWTLQELIAPSNALFFDRDWSRLGSRASLAASIQSTTGIPSHVLTGIVSLSDISIVDRFRWSVKRQTKEPEDKCYCLLGILGVKLLFNYGEKEEFAQRRLFDEIAKEHGAIVADDLRQYVQPRAAPTVSRDERFYPDLLIKSLRFQNMTSRRDVIELPAHATGSWLLKHPTYKHWLAMETGTDYNGFLWIKGRPGAGKSTLLKYADSETSQLNTHNTQQVSFYFNARGAELERSTIGMYRALVVQLCESVPHLERHICKRLKIFITPASKHLPEWSLEQLKNMLRVSLDEPDQFRVRCFVDALDECSTADVQDMINYFRDLTRLHPPTHQRFFVCFASRYYPALSIKGSVELRLDQQGAHVQDLSNYVEDRLSATNDRDEADIKQQIITRANGIFMWAVLVVKLLNEELLNGTLHNIRDIIQEFPQELDGIYKEIINRERANIERFRLCVQLVLFSHKPITGFELYYAIPHGPGGTGNVNVEQDGCEPPRTHIEKFVASSSRGLAELVSGDVDTVQFVHESVRDFFLVHQGMKYLYPHVAEELIPWCHDQIKAICEQYFMFAVSHLGKPLKYERKDVGWTRSSEGEFCIRIRLPLLGFAVKEIMFHAERAAARISQGSFIDGFDWKAFVHLRQLFKDADLTHDLYEDMGAAHVFAIHVAVNLMSSAARLGLDLDPKTQICSSPIATALVCSDINVVQQLLCYGVNTKRWDRFGDTLLSRAIQTPIRQPKSYPGQTIWRSQSKKLVGTYVKELPSEKAFILPWSGTEVDVVMMLLAYGAPLNQRNKDGGTALMVACGEPRIDVARLLLKRNATIDLADNNGTTALMIACERCDLDIVRLLLENKAATDAIDKTGMTAMMYACKSLSIDCNVEALIEYSRKDARHDLTIDHVLASESCCHSEVVNLLLDFDADHSRQDSRGKTALDLANERRDFCGSRLAALLQRQEPFVRRKHLFQKQKSSWSWQRLTSPRKGSSRHV